jgi:hypothetical protein
LLFRSKVLFEVSLISVVITLSDQLTVKVSPGSNKTIYAEKWRNRPNSGCRNSFRFMTYDCILESIAGEKANIGTFVITEGNRIQAALWTVYERCAVRVSTVLQKKVKKNTSTEHNLKSFPWRTGKRILKNSRQKFKYSIQH